jgi:hypothetical protein
MGVKTLSVWTLLAALAAAPALAQEEGGWAKRTNPRTLPPADPDEGVEVLDPPVPVVPPMPPIPALPGAPGAPGVPGDPPAPGVAPAGPRPDCPPIIGILGPQWQGVSGGVGLAVLRPYVTNNPAFTVVHPPAAGAAAGGPLLTAASETVTFDWDPELAYTFWLAYDDPSGWGGRLKAFVFDADSPAIRVLRAPGGALPAITAPAAGAVIPGLPGFGAPSPVLVGAGLGADRLAFQSDLRVVTIDAEGTYGWMFDDCSVQLSAGLRYLNLRQGYTATLVNPGDGTTFIAQGLRVTREFDGCGPTVGVFARQRICDSPFAVYAGGRCSILVGELDTDARFTQVIADPALAAGVGTQRTRTAFSSRADATIPTSELELGVEYGKLLGQFGLFVRAGVVAQTYFDAGGAVGSGGTLTLFGGQFAIGLAY